MFSVLVCLPHEQEQGIKCRTIDFFLCTNREATSSQGVNHVWFSLESLCSLDIDFISGCFCQSSLGFRLS